MIEPDEQLGLLRQFCPAAKLVEEGGRQAAFLPQYELEHLGVAHVMDLLLVPFPHSGYETRLLFQRRLPSGANAGQIWQQPMAIGRQWHAPSVRGVTPDQSWPGMIAEFLRVIS